MVGTRSRGAGLTLTGDGGAMEQRERGGGVPRLAGEPKTKWSLLGMRAPVFPSPTLPGQSRGGGGRPQEPSRRWGSAEEGGPERSDPRV